ncbi:MAG TPA: TolC family protein, partial [Candidatus Competibacteraceae bacterium]|nr:TolC family protein [Candidatus Competibacteraceae bacterium]
MQSGRYRWLTGIQLAWLVLPVCVQAAGSPREAEPPLGATVQGLLAWAEQHNPELAALQYETEAAEARIQPAGALPDPSFRVEWQDLSRSNSSLVPGQAESIKYTLSQPLPFWGKRELKQEVATAEVEQAQARRRATAAELRAKIKIAFAQYYQSWRAAILTDEMQLLLREMENLARTRYANGLSPQQDALKAQAEQTALRTSRIALETEQRQARARLNALLGRPTTAPLAEPRALSELPSPAKLANLEQRVQQSNPTLLGQLAQITAAEKNQQLVEKNRYPDLNVGVSPIQRKGEFDRWELMLEVNIPLQQETRRSQEREAAALLAAAQIRQEATTNQVLGDLQEALAGLESANR